MRNLTPTKVGKPSGFKTKIVAEKDNFGKGKKKIATVRVVE